MTQPGFEQPAAPARARPDQRDLSGRPVQVRRLVCKLPVMLPTLLAAGRGAAAADAEAAHAAHADHADHAGHGGATGAAPARASQGSAYARMAPFRCDNAGLSCASAASPAWGPDGRLWLAWAAGGAVSVASSSDQGASFSAPRQVGQHGAYLDIGPDARPQILVDRQGRVVLVYGVFKDDAWNARVLVSTSADGRSFSAPRPISDDAASQRFASIGFDPAGDLFAAWIDKRLVAQQQRQGRKRQGASIAYAWSADAGNSFSAARIAHPESCECCRIGLALPQAGRPVLVFRDVFEQRLRDHALLRFDAAQSPGSLHRVALDNWATDACPHHGPALAVSPAGVQHVAWFTQGQARRGVFHARSTDGGRSFSEPLPVAAPGEQAARPALWCDGQRAFMAWKSFDGQATSVRWRWSTDDGLSWSAPRTALQTRAYSDHPLLTAQAGIVYLSWLTQADGYRLVPLVPA